MVDHAAVRQAPGTLHLVRARHRPAEAVDGTRIGQRDDGLRGVVLRRLVASSRWRGTSAVTGTAIVRASVAGGLIIRVTSAGTAGTAGTTGIISGLTRSRPCTAGTRGTATTGGTAPGRTRATAGRIGGAACLSAVSSSRTV